MGFEFTKKTKTSIQVVAPYEGLQADSAKIHVQEILNNTTLEELMIISKVCKKPIIKSQALAKAKEYI